MTYKRIIRGGLASLAFFNFFVACMSVQSLSTSSEDTELLTSESQGEGNVEVKFSTFSNISDPGSYLSDVAFYLFNPSTDAFLKELAMTKTGTGSESVTYKSVQLEYGSYDLVIVTSDNSLTHPTSKSSVMYTMPNNTTTCPDIFYVSEDLEVNQHDISLQTSMDRNLSRVWIRLDDSNGVIDHDKEVEVSLSGVPSTLSWEGKFVSSNGGSVITIDLPENSTSEWENESDHYRTEDIEYIIPAHRGDNKPSYSLTLSLKATDSNGAAFERTAVIDGTTYKLPELNGTTRYNLIPQGANLEIVVETLDWNVEEEQEEVINGESDLSCIAMKTYGTVEVPIMDVYNEWNTSEGMFYSLNNHMEQNTTVVAEIVSGTNTDGAVESVAIVNRAGSWPHAVLRVDSTGKEGEATVGIKLQGDDLGNTNGGYRWKWHVKVSANGDACTTSGHPDSVNSN